MKKIHILKNTIQEYAWGSHTAIAQLLGNSSPSIVPQAELWMGAHPKATSMVKYGEQWVSLSELIDKYPEDILGKDIAHKFNNKLPCLFKVLAAAKPLSIQAHPEKTQAEQGFAKENELGIPLNAPNRNYKDDNHKPECICALTTFYALKGFRKIADICKFMKKICPNGLKKEIGDLQKQQDSQGLKQFFKALMTAESNKQKQLIKEAIDNAQKFSQEDFVFEWIIKLYNEYPHDIGIMSPSFLNLIQLESGQALFLPAGELHAYLDGTGIELMANSDNVLRGGLTPKHVDVDELLKILNFVEGKTNIITPKKSAKCENVYSTPAKEFVLSVISDDINYKSLEKRSVEIILCVNGKAIIASDKSNFIELTNGVSAIIPASVKQYSITGKAVIYKASVKMN